MSALGIDTNTPSLPIKTASGEGSCRLVWVAGCRLGAVGALSCFGLASGHCTLLQCKTGLRHGVTDHDWWGLPDSDLLRLGE